LASPTIVVLTDRNDLDGQLFGQFAKCSAFLRQEPQRAESRAHLKELLAGRRAHGIIFTTAQKFEEGFEGLSDRRDIVVMVDEAHRSQFIEERVDGKTGRLMKSFGLIIRESLPNATYIGFTGTPISRKDRSTIEVFGDYIDIYDMTRAVEDGTTVKIYYESRIAKLDLPEELKPRIDEEYEEITEYQEYTEKEKLKSKWARLEAIVGAKERVQQIAKDVVEHFEKRQAAQQTPGGKGMIVAMSRRIAIDLYNEIVALRPDWHGDELTGGKIKVVMTGASSDPGAWQKHIGTKATREALSKRMKDVNDELQLVIVRDMWLTGFDVPSMHTMYIDKPMNGHNLMQAIARVNRVFRDKQGGLVVDYIGIAENLKEALSQYTESDRESAGVDTELAAQVLLEKYDLILEMLHGHDYKKFFAGSASEKMQAIAETMDFVIGLREEGKKDYINLVGELARAYSLCATTDTAIHLNLEVGFHKAVRAGLVKLLTDDGKKKTASQLDEELKQLISKSISSNEVVDILESVGLNKPNIAILSDEFLEEVRGMKQKNLAVQLLERLLKGDLKGFSRRNLVQAKKFSELLDASIRKYQNRTIETTQVIMELIELAKEVSEAKRRGEATGLSQDELAFYDALADNESARTLMADDILRQIARELTTAIRNSISVDWTIRESVQAKMRMTIRRLLKFYDYPPDKRDSAIELVMQQTKLMCENELA